MHTIAFPLYMWLCRCMYVLYLPKRNVNTLRWIVTCTHTFRLTLKFIFHNEKVAEKFSVEATESLLIFSEFLLFQTIFWEVGVEIEMSTME